MKTTFVIIHKHLFDFFHIWNYYLGSLSATITSSKSKGALDMEIIEFIKLYFNVDEDIQTIVDVVLEESQSQPELRG